MVTPPPPKRLAILGTRGIPARYGGFETFAEEIAPRLAAKGVDVTVYCIKSGDERPREYKGVRLRYIASPPCGPFTTILFDLLCLVHAGNKFDVVYMLGYGTSFFCFFPRLWGVKVLINMDGIEWMRAKWNFWAKKWLMLSETLATKTANLLVADAQAVADFLRARHRSLPRVSVIAYGAARVETPPPLSHLSQWNLAPEQYYILVCRLEPENHVAEIIDGFRASAATRSLVIVGDHGLKSPYVRSLIEKKDERIAFLGAIYDKEKLLSLRYHAFAYFHGHSVGGTNPSLLEALGCANAVIAHDNVFNREVAVGAARFFKSAADIPPHIEAMETNKHSWLLMKREASAIVASRYGWERIADQYNELLESL